MSRLLASLAYIQESAASDSAAVAELLAAARAALQSGGIAPARAVARVNCATFACPQSLPVHFH